MEETARPRFGRKKAAVILFVFLGIIFAVAAFFYIRYKNTHISTDDAFIDGNVHTIAPKIYGTVKAVYVEDNQFVRKGALLTELDPIDYATKTRQASSALGAQQGRLLEDNARIVAARKQLAERKANIDAQAAAVALEEANLRQAKKDAIRAKNLFAKEAIPRERYERLTTDFDVQTAKVQAARQELRRARAAYAAQKAVLAESLAALVYQGSVIKQGKASLDLARLNEGYTKIHAPTDGYVTKKSVQVGNQVQPGQPLMAIVPLSETWVTANYKETQLTKIRPGQDVDIDVDTFPGVTFHGKVDSIMAGTGAVFSLFPPENATGNYVKVVQRVPVKIVLNPGEDPNHILRLGMSVQPTVIIK